ERAVVRDRGTDEPEPRPGAADDPPPDRWPPAAGDRRPPEEMPVDRPAAVEVQGVAVAVAGPAIAGVAGEHRIDRGVDRRLVNRAAVGTSKQSAEHREEHPVVRPDVTAVDLGDPVEDPPEGVRAERIEGGAYAGPAEPERGGHLGSLDDPLVPVADRAPPSGM